MRVREGNPTFRLKSPVDRLAIARTLRALRTEHGLLDVDPPTEPTTIAHPTDETVTSWTRCATVVDPTVVDPTESVR